MNNSFLLTLAIPTYNRAKVLDETLNHFINDKDFSDVIEIIISDNCSDDNTEEIVKKYTCQYENIKYYRNEENIKDRNFSKVLSLGSGKYIKIFNDTVRLNPGMLKFILNKVEENTPNEANILFYQNTSRFSNMNMICKGIDQFVDKASYWSTWTANYGIWRDQLYDLKDLDRVSHLQLSQVDWSLQMADIDKKIIIYFEDFFKISPVSKKGGYNFYQVFISNYLSILSPYIISKKLNRLTYEKEKYRLLKYCILPWTIIFFITSKENYSFKKNNYLKIIYNHYWYCPYFYMFSIYFTLRRIFHC